MTQSTTATCTTSQRGESSSVLGKMRFPSILRPVSWPYASGSDQDSVGRFLGTVQFNRILFPVRLSCWEATGPARREFANRLGVEIAEYLDSNSELCESGSIFHMSLYMVGASPSRAKPTVMFVSGDTKVRKDAFKIIKQSEILDAYPGFALAHMPLEAEYKDFRQLGGVEGGASINLSTRASTGSAATTTTAPPTTTPTTTTILTTKNGSSSGRRLYFLDGTDSNEQRRAATAGGIVSFQGRPMFLTVCHPASDTCGSDTKIQGDGDVNADEECEITGFGELDLGSQESSDENLVAITSRGSESPESSFSSADEAGSISSSATENTVFGKTILESLTQRPPEPTLRDPGTLDEATIQAGEVVLSSSEWDCLLVNLNPALLTDRIEESWTTLEDYAVFVEHGARDAPVMTTTPSGGTIDGSLSGTPSFVRLPFSTKFQQVYTVRFDKPLAPGDCGSWVKDAVTGKLFGHIIAGSPTTGLATIIPAHRLFAYLLSELKRRMSQELSVETQPPCATELSKPGSANTVPSIKQESKKRRASGGLKGLLSSFKKSRGGKKMSVDASEEDNFAQAEDSAAPPMDTMAAKSTPVAAMAVIPQPSANPAPTAIDHDSPSDLSGQYPKIRLENPKPPSPFIVSPFDMGFPSISPDLEQPSTETRPLMCFGDLLRDLGGYPNLYDYLDSSDLLYPSLTEDSSSCTDSSSNTGLLSHSSGFSAASSGFEALSTPPMSAFRAPTLECAGAASSDYQFYSQLPIDEQRGGQRASLVFFKSPDSFDDNGEPGNANSSEPTQQCPHPDCGKTFRDLKAHMLTHQIDRPEKCPFTTCDYHVKGFARKYDRNRHLLTHYKGTMVCGFCPGSGSAAEKSFNRADVFKRHLTAVHGVGQTPPNSRKKTSGSSAAGKKLTGYAPDATGKCSTCSQFFNHAQDFYEHLDDCVLRIVQQEDPAEAINATRFAQVENDPDLQNALERNRLPAVTSANWDAKHSDDDDEDEDMADDDETHTDPGSGNPPSRGLTHSRGGVPLSGTKARDRKSRHDYPSSWSFDKGPMTMKKRVMDVFDNPRRLVKDDMMLSTEHEVRVKLSDGKSYVTDLDVQTLKRAADFLGGTDEEKGPWISDDPTEEQMKQMMEMDASGHQTTAHHE